MASRNGWRQHPVVVVWLALVDAATDLALAVTQSVQNRLRRLLAALDGCLAARLLCRLRNHPKSVVMAQDHELFRQCPRCGRLPGISVEGRTMHLKKIPGDPNGPRVSIGSVVDTDHLSKEGQRRLLMAIYEQPDPEPEGRRPIFTDLDRIEMQFNRFNK